jgi:hypothetical protein
MSNSAESACVTQKKGRIASESLCSAGLMGVNRSGRNIDTIDEECEWDSNRTSRCRMYFRDHCSSPAEIRGRAHADYIDGCMLVTATRTASCPTCINACPFDLSFHPAGLLTCKQNPDGTKTKKAKERMASRWANHIRRQTQRQWEWNTQTYTSN